MLTFFKNHLFGRKQKNQLSTVEKDSCEQILAFSKNHIVMGQECNKNYQVSLYRIGNTVACRKLQLQKKAYINAAFSPDERLLAILIQHYDSPHPQSKIIFWDYTHNVMTTEWIQRDLPLGFYWRNYKDGGLGNSILWIISWGPLSSRSYLLQERRNNISIAENLAYDNDLSGITGKKVGFFNPQLSPSDCYAIWEGINGLSLIATNPDKPNIWVQIPTENSLQVSGHIAVRDASFSINEKYIAIVYCRAQGDQYSKEASIMIFDMFTHKFIYHQNKSFDYSNYCCHIFLSEETPKLAIIFKNTIEIIDFKQPNSNIIPLKSSLDSAKISADGKNILCITNDKKNEVFSIKNFSEKYGLTTVWQTPDPLPQLSNIHFNF